MTLSARNNVFKTAITICFLCLLQCIFASIRVIPIYALMEAEIARRPDGIIHGLIGNFFEVQLLAVHWGILALVLYSFFLIVFVYYFFEKTQSPEITFVVFFAASFSFEMLRLVLPLGRIYEIPSLYYLLASRLILFARCFGIFSLFAASVVAAGFEIQRLRNAIMLIILAALVIALWVPIDTQIWDSSLNMLSAYATMFRLIETGIFFITAVSFFIATWSRGSRKFIFIGIGAILALLGRAILLSADTWVSLPAGLVLLVLGTWLICTNFHKIYMWL